VYESEHNGVYGQSKDYNNNEWILVFAASMLSKQQ